VGQRGSSQTSIEQGRSGRCSAYFTYQAEDSRNLLFASGTGGGPVRPDPGPDPVQDGHPRDPICLPPEREAGWRGRARACSAYEVQCEGRNLGLPVQLLNVPGALADHRDQASSAFMDRAVKIRLPHPFRDCRRHDR
jgi:hypothetical protein